MRKALLAALMVAGLSSCMGPQGGGLREFGDPPPASSLPPPVYNNPIFIPWPTTSACGRK